MLGVRNLLEKGQFPKSQFIDIVPDEHPPQPEISMSVPASGAAQSAADLLQQSQEVKEPEQVPSVARSAGDVPMGESEGANVDSASSGATYGPIRKRCAGKQPEQFVYRPPEMRQDDLVEMLNELPIIDLTQQAAMPGNGDDPMNSPRGTSY